MGADKDIVDRLPLWKTGPVLREHPGYFLVHERDIDEAAAEIVRLREKAGELAIARSNDIAEISRLRGEVDKLKILLDGLTLSATIAPAEAKGDGWEENVRYLLDSYPGSIRVRPGAGPEELIGSLSVTFIKLRDLAMKAPQPADGEAVAWVCSPSENIAQHVGITSAERQKLIDNGFDVSHYRPLIYGATTPPAPVQAAPQEGGVPRFDGFNELPQAARDYIMWLETYADPAGTIQQNYRLTMENRALQVMIAEAARPSTCELGVVRELADQLRGELLHISPLWEATMYEKGRLSEKQRCIEMLDAIAPPLEAALQHRGDSQEVGRG